MENRTAEAWACLFLPFGCDRDTVCCMELTWLRTKALHPISFLWTRPNFGQTKFKSFINLGVIYAVFKNLKAYSSKTLFLHFKILPNGSQLRIKGCIFWPWSLSAVLIQFWDVFLDLNLSLEKKYNLGFYCVFKCSLIITLCLYFGKVI